jgi:serine protease SohB
LEFLAEYGMFLAKAATFAFVILFIVGSIAQMRKSTSDGDGELQIDNLNDKRDSRRDQLAAELLDKKALKKERKEKKESKKSSKAAQKGGEGKKGRVFVLEFKGDIYAKSVAHMREEISALLSMATTQDEVVVRLESSGGVVHGYGLAASQLDRIRSRGIKLTVAVDKVAASGGYMMACVADQIIAAPFAILGSIGVVGQVPNFSRLLDKHEIDYEMHTAGEYKRTLTMFAKNTERGREKFVEDLEQTHELFKAFVNDHRPQLDIDKVATGEIWFGRQAKDMQMVDELMTSDEYLANLMEAHQVLEIKFTPKKKLQEKLASSISMTVENGFDSFSEKLRNSRFMS